MQENQIIWEWHQLYTLETKSFTCGYCSEKISSQRGFTAINHQVKIYVCHVCNKPTFFDADGSQHPGEFYGDDVKHLPSKEVENLYREARSCLCVKAYTASILCSRKLLMNIAVSKGAGIGKTFKQYVEYLDSKNYIPPDGKEWVDHIRNKGNEATHEIEQMSLDDAKDLIDFLSMLMKFIYEFPHRIKKK